MKGDLRPEDVLKSLEKGRMAPFYLFHGQGEFRLEKVLDKIRGTLIPESARDFNLELLYGDKKTDPDDVINRARSVPFMAKMRLIILRRIENFNAAQLAKFVPYLENPSDTTCLIFITSKTDFRLGFYKMIRKAGRAVNFRELKDSEVVPWIRRAAGDLGLKMDGAACNYMQQIAGNRLRDIHGELEKLYLRYGENRVGLEEVQDIAINSRIYTIFELMNAISAKNCARALGILKRYLEEEDIRKAPLGILGMLNRQLRLLWKTKSILEKGGGKKEIEKMLGPARFSAGDFIHQSKSWDMGEFERGLSLLYQADALLKSSSRPKPVLENLILTLCG